MYKNCVVAERVIWEWRCDCGCSLMVGDFCAGLRREAGVVLHRF